MCKIVSGSLGVNGVLVLSPVMVASKTDRAGLHSDPNILARLVMHCLEERHNLATQCLVTLANVSMVHGMRGQIGQRAVLLAWEVCNLAIERLSKLRILAAILSQALTAFSVDAMLPSSVPTPIVNLVIGKIGVHVQWSATVLPGDSATSRPWVLVLESFVKVDSLSSRLAILPARTQTNVHLS